MGDEPTLGPGIGPTGEPTQLEQEPGGQLHGTGEPNAQETASSSSSSSTGKTAAKVGGGGAAGGGITKALSGLSAAESAAKALGTAGLVGGIWYWLTTAKNWVRVLEYLGGAILLYLGIKGLTGVDPVGDVAAVAR